jgi:small subunit ribosomal protein S16
MLAIRMQRTGRKGHAMFRVIVQESRLTPTSGKVVAMLGSYDPHAKTTTLDKEKAAAFLKNGAQPSERAASLLKREGVKLPKWVVANDKKAGKLKNPEKLRKNRPAEPAEEKPAEAEAAEEAPAESSEETKE